MLVLVCSRLLIRDSGANSYRFFDAILPTSSAVCFLVGRDIFLSVPIGFAEIGPPLLHSESQKEGTANYVPSVSSLLHFLSVAFYGMFIDEGATTCLRKDIYLVTTAWIFLR